MRWLFVALTAVLAGCFNPEPVAGAACSPEGLCPSGLACLAGVCVDEDDAGGACANAADGTPCGDATASDCDGADSCLAGACVANESAAGAACYDCDAGAGLCDACTAGTCTSAVCTLAAGAPVPGTLVSPIVSNNGDEGNMFDIVATKTITITSFETHSSDTAMTEYEIFTKTGTHVGSEGTMNAWTRVGGATFMLSGLNAFSPIPIPINVTIQAGQRQAFYLTNKTLNNRYHNGTAVGTVLVQTPELTLYEGTGNNYPFGNTAAPRAWEGRVHYRSGGGKTLAMPLTGAIAASGVMFDVAAIVDLEATQLAAHLVPGMHDVDVFFKRGTYAGAESQMMQWERAATLPGVVSAGANTPTNLALATPVFIEAGTTAAFYIVTSSQLRTAAGTAGASAATNADASIRNGVTVTGVFGASGAGANPNVELGYGVCD